jgi:hypothetical protein
MCSKKGLPSWNNEEKTDERQDAFKVPRRSLLDSTRLCKITHSGDQGQQLESSVSTVHAVLTVDLRTTWH